MSLEPLRSRLGILMERTPSVTCNGWCGHVSTPTVKCITSCFPQASDLDLSQLCTGTSNVQLCKSDHATWIAQNSSSLYVARWGAIKPPEIEIDTSRVRTYSRESDIADYSAKHTTTCAFQFKVSLITTSILWVIAKARTEPSHWLEIQ